VDNRKDGRCMEKLNYLGVILVNTKRGVNKNTSYCKRIHQHM
jgi:hypothetical protein